MCDSGRDAYERALRQAGKGILVVFLTSVLFWWAILELATWVWRRVF